VIKFRDIRGPHAETVLFFGPKLVLSSHHRSRATYSNVDWLSEIIRSVRLTDMYVEIMTKSKEYGIFL
jgi:hypothetical protein